MGQFVYVSLQDEDKIMVFALDPTTGSLTCLLYTSDAADE